MFNSHVFQSWLTVLAGGLIFALLFVLVGAMSELVMDGEMKITNKAISLGLLAFVGYVGVASFIRLRKPSD